MELKNMVENNDIEEFLAQVEAEGGNKNNSGKYINRDRLSAPISEDTGYSDLFTGYILEGYTSGIEGQYGESTAVRIIAPENGRRMTLWLTSYEQEHLKSHISNWSDGGASYPMEIKFLRYKADSKNGRKYNKFSATLLSHGDAVTIPAVPEDQFQDVDEDES